MKLVAFTVAGERYSVPVESVIEVVRAFNIKRIPKSPHYIEGIIIWRQKHLPVINMRVRFNEDRILSDSASRIVIVSDRDRVTGLLVDSVTDVMNIDANAIDPTDSMLKSSAFLQGVYSRDGQILFIIDVAQVLSDEEHLGLGQFEKEVLEKAE